MDHSRRYEDSSSRHPLPHLGHGLPRPHVPTLPRALHLDGGGIGAPSSGHNLFLRDQSLVGDLATTVKPDLVNSFLVQYARRHYNFPGVTGQPNLDIPNTLLFGHNFGVLDAIYETRVEATDSVAWVKGNHVAKFGADVNYVNNFVIWPGFTPMRIVMPGLNCLVDFANFVNPTAGIASNPADGPCPMATAPFSPTQPGAPFGASDRKIQQNLHPQRQLHLVAHI